MSTRTISPDSTVSQGSWTRTGGTTVHGVLSDNSDATYMSPPLSTTDVLEVGMANPPAPAANNRVTRVLLQMRVATPSSTSANMTYRLRSGGQDDTEHFTATFPVAATSVTPGPGIAFSPSGAPWTEAALNGLSVKWRLNTGNTTARLIDFDLDIEDNEAPTVVVIAPDDDDTTAAGTTVTTTSTPPTHFTYSDPESDNIERYEVRRYLQPTGGWTGFDPATTSQAPVETVTWTGAASGSPLTIEVTTMTKVLENGSTYRDYVRAADTTPSGFSIRYSPWAFREFTLALTPPGTPTITVTPFAADNHVQINLTADGAAPTTELYLVERSDDGGATWTEIRLSPVSNIGTLTDIVYDYEAPRSADGVDQPIQYRARAIDTTTGNWVYSAAVTTTPITLAGDGNAWLKSTSDPLLNMVLSVNATPTIDSSSEEPQGVYYAQGRYYPTVHSADIRAERFELQVSFTDDAERENFEALRALQEPLLLQLCTGDDGLEQHYIRLGGMRLWKRVIDPTQNTNQGAIYTITATEVAMP